ncbi:thioredoxin family protein [Terrimonas sp.]|uniref:thioredoxin family protein n=1 Tax=Terrimonas sp. TaxID=1914338 RepID=UPI000D507B66|nr:thioredoxin family protein [Terrimonas sp.]PVD51015.1 thioredoxin family protein [Terrimonas sp.]
MNWQQYLDYTHEILSEEKPQPPYDNPDYHHYTKMNDARMRRWVKTNPVTEETKAVLLQIQKPQQWIVITEPWCGDAAHIVPIIYLMSVQNNNITLQIQLRDSNSEIEQYLTGGTKSIPKLIVRDEKGKDLFSWGPRPREGQELYLSLRARKADFEETKVAIQNYYNNDKSLSTQKEIIALLKEQLA